MAKKTKKNSFTPILILAIVIVLAGVGYFGYKNLYTQSSISQVTVDTTSLITPQNTGTTKIYKNTDLGFQFEYSNSSTLSAGGSKADGVIFALTLNDTSLSQGKPYKDDETYFNLEIVKKGTQWLSNTYHCDAVTDISKNDIFNNFQKTKITSTNGAYNRRYLSYCVEEDEKIYLFQSSYSLSLGNGEKIEALFTNILSSFRFL